MKILVIGASGLVGGACYNLLSRKDGNQVTGTYRSFSPANRQLKFLDSADTNSLEILNEPWEVVIHTGALTNVDLCEQEPEKSYQETFLSTKIIIEKLKDNKRVHFIYISTDYVFDGVSGPYREDSETNPVNVYGRHKLETEMMILAELSNSAAVRITNVYGEEARNKNYVARLINQLQNNEKFEIKVPVDQFATPIYSYDVARVIELIIEKGLTGIFHAAGSDYFNRYQLVKKVLEYFPSDKVTVTSLPTSEFQQKAVRPLKGGLLCTRIYEESPDFLFANLDDYLKKNFQNKL